MRYIKSILLFIFIVLVSCSLQAETFHSKLMKVSADEFVFYTVTKSAQVQRYRLDGITAKPVLIETVSPTFPGEIRTERTYPNGKKETSITYHLAGYIDGVYFFVDGNTRKILEIRKNQKEIIERIVLKPMILNTIHKIDSGFLLTTSISVTGNPKDPCKNKYYFKKDPTWKDSDCFGTGPDIFKDIEFPSTSVLDNGKRTVLYRQKTTEIEFFDVETGNSLQKFKIESSPEILAKLAEPSNEEFYDSKGKTYFIKHSTKNTSTVFIIDNQKLETVCSFTESENQAVILNGFLVYCVNGGQFEVKKLD